MEYTPIVGMEIHVELKTNSKMFCGCKNDPFYAEKPNIYTCPVCLGMPGALPVPNKKAVEWTILLGLALGCEIPLFSKFDRKNYFYPDLAKGYQLSQYDQPLCRNGMLNVQCPMINGKDAYTKTVRIRRVHLEEDTGKLHHDTVDSQKVTLVDFNRCGVPLVEIVTEPDIRSGEEAKAFLKALHQIVRYLDISDADMEKGSMRLEPNISVMASSFKPQASSGILEEKDLPKYKVEVKNINSFNFVKKAIEFEVKRHEEILEKGEIPPQETRGWNEDKNITVSQRRKEEANDYRYFPDPDIPPLRFAQDYIDALRKQLPELPSAKKERFEKQYQLSPSDAELLIDDHKTANYFEAAVSVGKLSKIVPKTIANWIINKKVTLSSLGPEGLIQMIMAATMVIDVSDEEMNAAIAAVVGANPKAVTDYKSGKEQVIMFLLGMTIKELKGKGDKGKILEVLKKL